MSVQTPDQHETLKPPARSLRPPEPPKIEPAIVIHDVMKLYDNVLALADFSLAVRKGEILGLLGPNGCGKTTTINLLCGLTRPTSGSIKVFGHDITSDTKRVRSLLGVVSQETALYEELDARANLMFHAELYGVPRKQRAKRVEASLKLVGLEDRQKGRVRTFSGGMKRRVAIARALLHDPMVIYLDEPTLGVDVPSRRAIWDHIRLLRRVGKTVLLTTNYLEEANELCDRIAIMNKGRLAAIDTPSGLKKRFGNTIVELGVDHKPSDVLLRRMRAAPGVTALRANNDRVDVAYAHGLADPATIINLVTIECRLRSINERHPTLDEVFMRLTNERGDA